MEKINDLVQNLTQAALKDRIKVRDGEELIKVNIMTSTVALLYEKLRTFIDYNEEHLLRKNAINRIIKRRFVERGKVGKIAENIIRELVSAGYLPNNKIPEAMKVEVAEVITKYQLLFEEIQDKKGFFNKAVKIYNWLMNIAAVEIEERLVPSNTEKVYVKFMYDEMRRHLELEYPDLDEQTEDLYMYLAVYQSLIKSDRPMLNYFLLRLYFPQWKDNYEQLIPYLAENIDEVKEQLETPIDNKIVNKLIKKMRRYATMINIMKEVLESQETDAARINDDEYLRERITDVTNKKYKSVHKKLNTSITRAIVYVFLTKMLLALAIEVPIDKYLYGKVHVLSVFVNIAFPVILMILIAITISAPGKKNTEEMVDGVMQMFGSDHVKAEYLRPEKKRSGFTYFLFNMIYVVSFLIPFVLIIKILGILNFSILSMILFMVFLSIVSFFGVRIRHYAKDLEVIKRKETFFTELFDFFTLPIIRFGRWLSLNFSKVNVFAIFLDFFIEAPLKLVLQVLDDWFGFVKEKKDQY